MTTNNFKVAFRVLWKQKINTALNISGIAIGMACFLMISLYIKQEVTFDQFHEKGDNIYRVWAKENYGEGEVFFYTTSALPLAPTLEANIPEVEATVQYDFSRFLVGEGEGRINERVAIASPNFFDVFTFPMVAGSGDQPFRDRNAIVISERYATKYFGDQNPIGELMTLEVGGAARQYNVSAVVQNMPRNSGFQFDMMVSNENKQLYYSARQLQAWFNIAPETYVLLKEGTNPDQVLAKFPNMINTVLGDEVNPGEYELGMQLLGDIHLEPEFPAGILPVGNPKYVYVLGTIGLLVLIIACINYTTLSTGQSMKRAKEVGVRKVVGAKHGGLVWHFLTESVLISFLATVAGVVLSYLLLPVFNNLANTQLSLPLNIASLFTYLFIALAVGIFTGLYPAFVLSKLKLTSVLRGGVQAGGGNLFSKSLVVFQLLLTVFLISGTLIIRKQMKFLQNADLGFDKEAVVSVNLYGDPASNGMVQRIESALDNAELFKNRLESNPAVSNIGIGNHVFGNPGWTQVGFDDDQGQFRQFKLLLTDPHYLSSFGITMLEGRNFDENLDLDKRESIIINQAAADFFGFEEAVGKKLPGPEFGNHTIIGVTENFNYESLHNEVEPLVIVQNIRLIMQGINDIGINASPIPKLVFKYTGGNLMDVQNVLNDAWADTFPNEELSFNFIDERLRLQYQNEARINKIVSIATVISIMIASFGLLGLIILAINTRLKEIGIRKVLGASHGTIFMMLFKGFSVQLLIAILLSVPITYFLMTDWLNDFAYKVNFGVTEFGLAGLISLLITLTVISYNAIKASRANPVNSLRTE